MYYNARHTDVCVYIREEIASTSSLHVKLRLGTQKYTYTYICILRESVRARVSAIIDDSAGSSINSFSLFDESKSKLTFSTFVTLSKSLSRPSVVHVYLYIAIRSPVQIFVHVSVQWSAFLDLGFTYSWLQSARDREGTFEISPCTNSRFSADSWNCFPHEN